MSKDFKVFIVIVSLIILAICCVLWAAVQLRSAVQLGNGYRYYNIDYGGGVFIDCAPKGEKEGRERLQKAAERAEREQVEFKGLPKAGPDVDGYHVYPHIITGHVSKVQDPILTSVEERPLGYFVIDVHNDQIYDGLNKQEWLKKLHSFGIHREPELFRPSIFDRILGRNKP